MVVCVVVRGRFGVGVSTVRGGGVKRGRGQRGRGAEWTHRRVPMKKRRGIEREREKQQENDTLDISDSVHSFDMALFGKTRYESSNRNAL